MKVARVFTWMVVAALVVVADDYMEIKEYDTTYDSPNNPHLSIQKLQLQMNHVKGDLQETMETSAKHSELVEVEQKTDNALNHISRLQNEVDAIDYENLKRRLNKKIENVYDRINKLRSELTKVIQDNKDNISKMLKNEVTVMKGELDDVDTDVSNLQSDLMASSDRSIRKINDVDERLSGINQNLVDLNNRNKIRLTKMLDSQVTRLDQKVENVDSKVYSVQSNLTKYVKQLESKNWELEQKVKAMENMYSGIPADDLKAMLNQWRKQQGLKPLSSSTAPAAAPSSVSKENKSIRIIKPGTQSGNYIYDHKLQEFSPTTFKLTKATPIYDTPNGTALKNWESGRKFTAYSVAGDFIKISGVFVNSHWMQLTDPLWVNKQNVQAIR